MACQQNAQRGIFVQWTFPTLNSNMTWKLQRKLPLNGRPNTQACCGLHVKKTVSFHVNRWTRWTVENSRRKNVVVFFLFNVVTIFWVPVKWHSATNSGATIHRVWSLNLLCYSMRPKVMINKLRPFLTDDTIQSTFNLISNSYSYNEMPYLD